MPEQDKEKVNTEKIAQFEARMAEDEKKEAAQKASAAQFDPMLLIKETSEIFSFKDEVLGTVRFGRLSLKEFKSFESVVNVEERAYRILHAMLKKAYPKLTYEQIELMPFDKVARLSTLLSAEVTRFLPKQP
jgi:hypothetical protein